MVFTTWWWEWNPDMWLYGCYTWIHPVWSWVHRLDMDIPQPVGILAVLWTEQFTNNSFRMGSRFVKETNLTYFMNSSSGALTSPMVLNRILYDYTCSVFMHAPGCFVGNVKCGSSPPNAAHSGFHSSEQYCNG